MTSKVLAVVPSPSVGDRRRKPVEATALVAFRTLSAGELDRVAHVLAAAGFADLHATRIRFTAEDAQAVSHGESRPIPATVVPDQLSHPSPEAASDSALDTALDEARARGAALQEDLLADPAMLSTATIAARLGMSEEGVRLKRRRHEILGLEFAKRGIRYPAWQVLQDRQLLPALPQLFVILGDDPWRVFRFLQQHHAELGGQCTVEALRRGHADAVLAAAENVASSAFA